MNKETAHLYLPLVQALADGKAIEYFRGPIKGWLKLVEVDFSQDPSRYRIRPEPDMVPLELDDVPLELDDFPPGSALRAIGNSEWWMVYNACKFGVSFASFWRDYIELQGTHEIKRPGEDWMPCHKPA